MGNGFLEVNTEKVISGYVHGVPIYKDILVADESVRGGSNVTITANEGNDVIQNVGGAKITIDAGACDNQVSLIGAGKTISVKADGGRNLISVGSGWSDFTINGGDEKDIVVNKANKAIIKTGALNDLIKNYGDSVTIDGGEDNDKLLGEWDNDTLNGGNGDDTLSGGTGNDKLYGEAGNDKLYGGADDDCIKGGTGNDSLWGDAGADKFFYSKGDGKDVIFGFDSKDTLTFDNIIFKTSMASYNKSEGTLTLNLSGGSVTLKDFTTSTFHINSDIYKINGSTLKKQ